MIACCLYVQVWAVSGEPRSFSGGSPGSSPHRWDTPAASHQTPITKRCAQVIGLVPHLRICTFLHTQTVLHFDICCPDPTPFPSEEVEWVGRTLHHEISQGSRDQTGKKKKIRSRKGCFKCSALILLLPLLHLQSTTQNALLQMGCTPHPHPPMTYL